MILSILLGVKALFSGKRKLKLPLVKTTAPSHEKFHELLQKYVDNNGAINYKGLLSEKHQLVVCLDQLSADFPGTNWNKKEELAYWINVYNAFTLKLILDNYPVKSIKEIGGKLPFVNSPWDIKFIPIGNQMTDLNTIEHYVLRKKFNEPRIHFAIVCASASCPGLLNEAYTADKIEEQLTNRAKTFIGDVKRNKISKNKIVLSKIFSWYKQDFTKKMPLVQYINQYTNHAIESTAKIEFSDYDWSLNESKRLISDIPTLIKTIIASVFKVNVKSLNADSCFPDELNADSLDIVELVMEFEK